MNKNFSREELIELTSLDGGRFSVEGIIEAYHFCRKLALGHYENFPVGSLLIPKTLKNSIYSIYSFARIADDIADEPTFLDQEERIKFLSDIIDNLKKVINNEQTSNPVFLALGQTINDFSLPLLPFEKLITAFKMDVNFNQPLNWDNLLDYCVHSANPIGELILRLFDNYNKDTSLLSDFICSALQLVNFWQDLSIDLKKDRIYIPLNILEKYKLSDYNFKLKNFNEEKNLFNGEKLIIFNVCLSEIFNYSENLFIKGSDLIILIKNRRLRAELASIIYGGIKILEKCRLLSSGLLTKRPVLSKFDYFIILLKGLFRPSLGFNGKYNPNRISYLRKC